MTVKNVGTGVLPSALGKKFNAAATDHARHLAEYVFIPAYESGFVHGAKHMYEEFMTDDVPTVGVTEEQLSTLRKIPGYTKRKEDKNAT